MLEIQAVKDPEQPGEILYRARWLAEDGAVVRVLGTRTYDEDEVTERGHAAIRAEVDAWARELAVAKGFTP